MKTIQAGLTDSTTTTYGDLTKTYLAGRVFEKTINSQQVLGPPLTNFIDVQTDTIVGGGVSPGVLYMSPNGRLFVGQAITGGQMVIVLYNFDLSGVNPPVYIGRINVNFPSTPSTTHTLRNFEVYDGPNAGTLTGWKIIISTTTSVAINGGTFVVNNVDYADFVPVSPPTFGLAISSNAKANYFLQDPGAIGVGNNITAINCGALDRASQEYYVNFGLVAVTQFTKWDLTQTLNYVTQTTTAATVPASPTFTLTGHGYVNNDPVVLISNQPTPFTASTATTQTVYFIRNASANTFELSATSGGASINATSAVSGTEIGRAFGTTTSAWMSVRTGIIPSFSGTIINATQSQHLVIPTQTTDPTIPAGLNNQLCYFMATQTNFYLFPVSEITNGAITLPSLSAVNGSGATNSYTAIGVQAACYSSCTGQVIYTSNASAFYSKKWLNNQINIAFGGLNTLWWEGIVPVATTNFSAVTIAALNTLPVEGWLAFAANTTGQRGVFYMDFRSHSSFGYSYIVSKLLDTSKTQTFEFVSNIEQLFDETNSSIISYRTALTDTDPIFSTPDGGWIVLDNNVLHNSQVLLNYTQLKIEFEIATLGAQTPSQIHDTYLTLVSQNEISANWTGSVDNTTGNSVSPAKTAFRLVSAYDSVVPTMYFRAYDDSGNLVVSANTSANAADFEYTTNNGTSWNALGTIPNVINTTEIRYNWAVPPGVKVTVSLRES